MKVADLFRTDCTEPDYERRQSALAWAEPFGDDIEGALDACPPGVMLMILAGIALYTGDFALLRENVFEAMRVACKPTKARIARAFREIREPTPKLPAVKARMADFLRLGGAPRMVGSVAFTKMDPNLN